jgi:hypothetical protein
MKRIERVLNRPTLPPPGSLLTVVATLRNTIDVAYTELPLRRLGLLRETLTSVYDSIEDDLFADRKPNGDVTKVLRQSYARAAKLVEDLTTNTKTETEPETLLQINKFLEAAATRGWRVTECTEDIEEQECADGFAQSYQCIQTISPARNGLLQKDVDAGVVSAPVLLLTETTVPENVLTTWAQDVDVYIVFGSYTVITPCQFIGIAPYFVLCKDGSMRTDRFEIFADYLSVEGTVMHKTIIPYPRRIADHYYCPVVNVKAVQHKYFKNWDLLTKG